MVTTWQPKARTEYERIFDQDMWHVWSCGARVGVFGRNDDGTYGLSKRATLDEAAADVVQYAIAIARSKAFSEGRDDDDDWLEDEQY